MAEHSLDIFKLLSDIDKGKLNIWESLSEEERKGFAPLITMRWMSGSEDMRQLIYLNELVNPVIFSLGKHPQLLMKLLTVCSSKQPRRYSWLKQHNPKKAKRTISVKIVQDYYKCCEREAKDYTNMLGLDDLVLMAESLGYQKEEIVALKRELK